MTEFLEACRVLGVRRALWLRRGYRPFSRLLHRFNLHYAPPNHGLTNDAGWPLHWCQWCGLRDHVMPSNSIHHGILGGGDNAAR